MISRVSTKSDPDGSASDGCTLVVPLKPGWLVVYLEVGTALFMAWEGGWLVYICIGMGRGRGERRSWSETRIDWKIDNPAIWTGRLWR